MQHFNSGTNEISNFSRMKTIDHHNRNIESAFIKLVKENMDEQSISIFHADNKMLHKRRCGMEISEREKSEMKAFIDFLCDCSPIYLGPVLTNSNYVLEVEYKKERVNPIIAQYIFDIYKLLFENELMSGYKIWALEQQGECEYGYHFHNTINEIIYLYIKYMRLMTPNCSKLNIIKKKMDKRFHDYYGFSPVKE